MGMWFWKPSGCQHGEDCLHCHVCPESEIANRRKRRKARLGAAKKNYREADVKYVLCGISDCDTSADPASDVETLASASPQQSPAPSPLASPRQAGPNLPPGVFLGDQSSRRPFALGRKLATQLPPLVDARCYVVREVASQL